MADTGTGNSRRAFEGQGTPDEMFAVQEAYKAIRTNIILSVIKDGCKRLVVTSPLAGEGKSTTAINVAISLAQAYNRVLIVDCDLRRPRVHKALGAAGNPGLTNVLSGMAAVRDAVQPTKFDNLCVMAAGLAAPNPAEMLASPKMAALLDELSASFDYILLDTPPINVVSDALPIAKVSDGVVLIVRRKKSVHSEIQKALAALEFIQAKVIGLVLNDAEDDSKKNARYRSRYRYGYGTPGAVKK